jgi:hypothetical protein
MVVSGGGCSKYLATAEFVEEVDSLFSSFNGGMSVDPGKALHCPLSDNSPHIGHWTKASVGVSSWIFLKDSKPAFFRPPPSQNGWLIDIAAAQHAYLQTRNLNQDPLENTFGVIRSYCGSNDDPTVGQFIDALKTSIINGLSFRGLHGTNCKDDGTTLLDDLHSFLRASDASPLNSTTCHGRENPDDVSDSFHVAEKIQQKVAAAVFAGDMEVFSVAYVSGFIARQLLCGVSCDACTACLTSQVMLSTNAFIYFKEYSDTEQSLTYPSEKLVETVGTSITLLETMMAEVAHFSSAEQHITTAIKNDVDFDWIRSTGCSLHHGIVRGITRISIPW